MTPVVWILYVLAAVAAVLAWTVVRRRPVHAPVAWLLSIQVVTDVFRRVLREYVLIPQYAKLGGGPATGWLRLAAHTEQTLFLAWRVGIAALAVWVIHTAQRRAFVLDMLQELPLDLRAILIAHDIDGIPMPEIAEVHGISLSTAYKRRVQALAAFKEAAENRRREQKEGASTAIPRWHPPHNV